MSKFEMDSAIEQVEKRVYEAMMTMCPNTAYVDEALRVAREAGRAYFNSYKYDVLQGTYSVK